MDSQNKRSEAPRSEDVHEAASLLLSRLEPLEALACKPGTLKRGGALSGNILTMHLLTFQERLGMVC